MTLGCTAPLCLTSMREVAHITLSGDLPRMPLTNVMKPMDKMKPALLWLRAAFWRPLDLARVDRSLRPRHP